MFPAPQRAFPAGPLVPAEVATIAELSALGVNELPQGWSVFVRSLRQFCCIFTSTLLPVANQIIASQDPTKLWFAQPYPTGSANPWASQVAWQVNAVTGSNENTGGPGSPLATYAEFERRLAGTTLAVQYTVSFTSAAGLVGGLDVTADLGPGGSLVLDFSAACTVVMNGIVGAGGFADPVPATPEYAVLNATAVMTGHTNRRIRMTSGAALGGVSSIALLHPPGTADDSWARVGVFYTYVPATNVATVVPAANIAAGNTFAIETQPVVPIMRVSAQKQVAVGGVAASVAVIGAQCGTNAAPQDVVSMGPRGAVVTFFGCKIYPATIWAQATEFVGCWLGADAPGAHFDAVGVLPYELVFRGAVFSNRPPFVSNCTLNRCLSQSSGASGLLINEGQSQTVGPVGVFGAAADGVEVPAGVVSSGWLDGAGVFGNANVGNGYHIVSPNWVGQYGAIPTITGGAGLDLRVAGYNGGAGPNVCTWAQFAAGAPAPLTIPGAYISDLGSGLSYSIA